MTNDGNKPVKNDSYFPFAHFINLDGNNDEKIQDIAPEEKKLTDSFSSQSNEYVNEANMATSAFSQEEINLISSELLNSLQETVNPQKYKAFFDQSFYISNITEEFIECTVTTSFIKKMIENHYIDHLKNSITATLGKPLNVTINVGKTNSSLGQQETSNKYNPTDYTIQKGRNVKETRFTINDFNEIRNDREEMLDEATHKLQKQINPNSGNFNIDVKKTFESFIVGPSNNMAHAASLAVSKSPGKVYPSLYIYSASGLGKTHLLHAVGNNIAQMYPNKRIYFISANDFMIEVVNAIKTNEREKFRKKYSESVDVLMIDDIHELKNKTSTQNEFFNIFNELHNNGKQLIFTSDKMPKEIDGVEERIKTRLSWGLVVDIQQPDLETRIAILKHKALSEDIFLPDDVVNLIASSIKTNIRELEGSLIKLGAYSSVFAVDIDVEIAKQQLKLEDNIEVKNITLDSIAKAIASYYRIPLADIKSRSRQKDVTLARHLGMYLSYQIIKSTLSEIGKFYGNRDHTSVMHAIDKIKKKVKTDSQISQQLVDIENNL